MLVVDEVYVHPQEKCQALLSELFGPVSFAPTDLKQIRQSVLHLQMFLAILYKLQSFQVQTRKFYEGCNLFITQVPQRQQNIYYSP